MKNLPVFFILSLIFTLSFGQNIEFEVHPNGLIYNEPTMNQLKKMASSADLKCRNRALSKTSHAKYQAKGHYILFERAGRKRLEEAAKDLKNNLPIEDFLEKYPDAHVNKNILITKSQFIDIDGNNVIEFSHLFSYEWNPIAIRLKATPEMYVNKMQNKFLFSMPYEIARKPVFSEYIIKAFYFVTEFEKQALPEKYARMIQYADCMIDTTASKSMQNAASENLYLPLNYEKLSKKEKEQLLEKFRSTKVVGLCSQDVRPRTHAKDIAQLSADTDNWQMFLRAHLDLVNDQFERISAGDDARNTRKTYVKELEGLNINLSDLIIGISLQMENPITDHYYGNIWRLGQVLAEIKYPKKIEAQILSMIEDEQLDVYNRVVCSLLFFYYCRSTKNESQKKVIYKKLENAVETLPESNRIYFTLEDEK